MSQIHPDYKGIELQKPRKVGKLQFIIVGTGRCGSVYAAKLISSLGMPCSHEAIFKYDGVEKAMERMTKEAYVSAIAQLASVSDEEEGVRWFAQDKQEIVAEASYMAVPYLQHTCLKDASIVHLIREPMNVINSFVEGFQYFQDASLGLQDYKEYHEFIYSFIPRLYDKDLTPVDRAALYWCEWNEMIEKLSEGKRYCRWQIEYSPGRALAFMGLTERKSQYKNKKSNHKIGLKSKYTSLEQIPNVEIRERTIKLRRRYYSILM